MLRGGFIRAIWEGILSSSRSRNKNQWREIPEENNGGF